VLGDQVANLNMGAAEQKSVSAEALSDISPADPITFAQRWRMLYSASPALFQANNR